MSTRLDDRAPGAEIIPAAAARVGAPLAAPVFLALAVAVAMECLRVLFPIVYTYEGEAGIQRSALILVGIMVAPAVAPVVARRFGVARTVQVAAVALVATRVALQLVSEIPLALVAVAVAVALFTVVAGMLWLAHDPLTLGIAFVAGLALDTMVRGLNITWDLAWRPGAWPWAIVIAASAGLVISATISDGRLAGESRPIPARAAFVIGPYLFLQVLFVQSPAFVASSAGVSLAAAIAVVLAGDLAALAALGLLTQCRWRPVHGALAGVALAALAWTLTGATGSRVIVIVLAVQFLATLLFATGLRSTAEPGSTTLLALSTGAGFLLFAVLLLEYQLHYETPLPVTNRWIPVLAGASMAVAGVRRATSETPSDGALRRMFELAAAIVVAGVIVAGGLALTEPDLKPTPVAGSALRVMTYNVDETVTRHGQLDPTVFAATVRKLHPDVLVVEESGRGWPISSTMDLAGWAQRHLRLRYVWAPAADHQFGTLMFSRVPIQSARVVALPQGSGTMKRSAIIAEVGPVGGRTMTVIGTHLQNGHTPSIKQTRVDEIEVLLHEWGNAPRTVIAGDLNSDPGSRELRTILAAGFSTTQPAYSCTLKTSNNNCVDWILITSDLTQSAPTVLPIETYDHRPLTTTVGTR